MSAQNSPNPRASVEDRQTGESLRRAPRSAAALPLPVTTVSAGPSRPAPDPLKTRANIENAEFRRSGLLPPRDNGLQRRERQMFLYLFLGMLLLFAGLLAVILASRI